MRVILLSVSIALACGACPSPPAPSTPSTTAAGTEARPTPGEPIPPLPSETMIETMVSHAVLTHARVVPFLHLEISSNLPLKVHAGPDLARGAPALHAGGQPVVIVPKEQARVILESRERLDRSTSRIRFQIPAEGVSGHVDVALRDGVWTGVGAEVAER